MSTGFPHLPLLARILMTCLMLYGLGVAGQDLDPGRRTAAVRSTSSSSGDPVVWPPQGNDEPAGLPNAAPPTPTATPVPPIATSRPTPPPSQPPRDPQWWRVKVETPLRVGPEQGSPVLQSLPGASYLKLLHRGDGMLQVYYGGNGDDRDPGEGWVNVSDVVVSDAPKWVEVRRATALWSDRSGGSAVGTLPAGAVAEVMQDRGGRLQVFYLGDGFSRAPAEGWTDVSDLGPAGPLIVSERWGLRVLRKADVQAIDAGEGVWLRVPFRTQLDGSLSADANCGPASVAMALQYYRMAVPTGEVRILADRLQGTSDPEGGFAIEFLAAAVERFGLKGLDLAHDKDNLKRWTLDDLRRHVGLGHPVIAQLRFRAMPAREFSKYGDDHYVVICGMLGDDFIYNDSVDTDGPGYGRVISSADLKRAWGSSHFPFAAFAVSGH